MFNCYSKKIAPYVKTELELAANASKAGNIELEFQYLENAHVLGQASTYWHIKVHVLMMFWAVRNLKLKEIIGQVFRIVGASTKTVFGLVPQGNTGGTNVNPFKSMPIKPEHQLIIKKAKSNV
ncbi:DUF3703 domain-containing protein [uncultured Cocleimonas sp.]|uniref:DUF3703 domain-containing protein n=1 Tax=uncultured Cocleimonas sp. TaxID=1051587 RepID=UPI002632DF69|nr:DUF3703 domain-containing protein [uncultured Cocleimonas sp.]